MPEPTLRRLPRYYHLLERLAEEGAEVVATAKVAGTLGLDAAQVRKDLGLTGAEGRPRVGYPIAPTLRAIERFLGWSNTTDAFLVGAGHLGTALLGYDELGRYGIRIVAAFDTDPAKVDRPLCGREVFDVKRLGGLMRRMHIRIGVIATPAQAAHGVAKIMVEAGARALWNLTPAALQVPEGIIVVNEQIYASLAVLSRRLEALDEAD